MKRYVLIIFVLVLMSFFSNSTSILEFNETDYINLRPSAYDKDNEPLTYFFQSPLSSKGTWATNYGDAGIYHTKVKVSDGRLLTEENITLIIHKKEEPPLIISAEPKQNQLDITEGDSILFNVQAEDINKDNLTIEWLLNSQKVAEGYSFTYLPDYYSVGNYSIHTIVSDGVYNVSKNWNISIEKFDRSALLDNFFTSTINETQIIKFELPDFSKYSLFYNISEPLGNDAEWQTTYEDVGVYNITIKIWDNKTFYATKKIKITVLNVNRLPEMLSKKSYWISENERLEAYLEFFEPDNDVILIQAFDLPSGAEFENNTIIWAPSFETVNKETVLDSIARNYHVMNKLFIIPINVTDDDVTITLPIEVRVFDTNRRPVLNDIQDITVKEGEIIHLDISAHDSDNDTIRIAFEGFLDKNDFSTKVGDRGTYIVKVIASDGFHQDSKNVKVTILPVNQPPSIKPVKPMSLKEAQRIEILLNAQDTDSDSLSYSLTPLPNGAYIKANKFVWAPDFDTVQKESSHIFELAFTVSDHNQNATTFSQITVNNVNRPPQIITSSQIDGKTFYVGDEVEFFVKIFDPDKDDISYKWETGFERFESDNIISVQFSTPGKKRVIVTASDGQASVKRDWLINVKKRPKINIVFWNQ